ncbi:hypothetical protein NX059_007288 [Plenodomus lindquistii]|nr:hypothetical protein NX059_007288 [Plenodomus lindquistii]
MTSRTFDAALSEPDDDASQSQLRQLIAANDFSSLTSANAEQYLQAFCNHEFSYARRRWIGLTLAGMIGAASISIDCLQKPPQALQKLGSVVLSDTELEVTKIVAGLVMRQALAHSIEYNLFWASDKVRNSAPNFPQHIDVRWMPRFQDFLDALHSLALTTSTNDASTMYPISLNSPGEFEWGKSDEGLPVAIIQAENLTVILPDRDLCDVHFLDVPIDHILSARSRQATLHDSQARVPKHAPWEVILTLQANPWSYRLNTSPHQGTELIFLFEHTPDAKEWEGCVKAHQQSTSTSMGPPPPKAHPHMSSSSPIKCGAASPLTSNAKSQTTGVPQPRQRLTQLRSSGRNPQSHEEPEGATQDHTTDPKPKSTGSAQASRAREGVVTNDKSVAAVESTEERSSRSRSSQAANRMEKAASRSRLREHSSSDEYSSGHSTVPQPAQEISMPEPTASSKGRLPKVSQSTKDKVVKRLPEPASDLDIPTDSSAETDEPRTKAANTTEKLGAKPQQQSNPSRTAKQSQKPSTRSTRSRVKRKADDDNDDEFIPDEIRSRKSTTTTANRRSGARAVAGTNKRRKMMHKGSSEAMVAMSDEAQGSTRDINDATIIPIPSELTGKARKLREAELHVPKDPIPPGRTTKASLINGLLDSQRPAKPAKPSSDTFKKPLPPAQSAQFPSTPTKVRTKPAEPSTRVQTPVDRLMQSTHRARSIFHSSPPPRHTADGSDVWTPHVAMHREVLSSNSKPVPASPNAESTAISGHADREAVDMEKEKADVQTARSDPFRQRRSNHKVSSFTRRLTGEGADGSPTRSINITGSGNSEPQPLEVMTMNEQLPEVLSSVRKDHQRRDMTPMLRSGTPLKHRSRQIVWTNHTSRQLHQAGQSSPLKIFGASTRSERHTTKGSSGRPADTTLRDADRESTGRSVPPSVRSRMAEIVEKRLDQDLQHTTHESIMAAPLQLVEDTQLASAAPGIPGQYQYMHGDETLVNNDEDGLGTAGFANSSVNFPSSPPIGGSPSNHSSTSADSDLLPTDPPIPNSDAEELEWEASLNPHQRALHDLLIRTSKRVLRHVVDNEAAVTDIAEIFERDGEHVLRSLLERHDGDYEHVFDELDVEGKRLQNELQDVAEHLAKQRKRIRAIV